jgi:Predicted RNA-binding protein
VSETLATEGLATEGGATTDEEAPVSRDGRNEVPSEDLLVQEGDAAGDYLERLLDLIDYDGDIDLDVEAGRAVVSIEGGDDLEKLVGPEGCGVGGAAGVDPPRRAAGHGRAEPVMLDIAQWRAARRAELTDLGRRTAEKVRGEGNRSACR